MIDTIPEKYTIRHVILGSINGLPPMYTELPIDPTVAKIRYMHTSGATRGGPTNTMGYTFGVIGLVDDTGVVFRNGGEGMSPHLELNREQARLVKSFDMIVVPDNGTSVVLVKETLLNKRNYRPLKRLARMLYNKVNLFNLNNIKAVYYSTK